MAKKGEEIIFEYNDTVGKFNQISPDYEEHIKKIFQITGFYDITFEFTPNNRLVFTSNDSSYIFGGNNMLKKIETFNAYDNWFKDFLKCVAKI